ncbi:hypothetical protein COCNU_16G008100 [Cocos nucifera]|uniref:Uncharacterized protein n=1 Tax=Cocos nucifera TaxID=13894 RepID=A0A8K0IZ06_COCNU|nr:hypothetical protein COCNU_16G008100 [Cocos nucifera]
MQRAAQGEAKPKEEESVKKMHIYHGGESSPRSIERSDVISDNPSIDKLNEEAANIHQMQADSSTNNHQNGAIYNSGWSLRDQIWDSTVTSQENFSDVDFKRKKLEIEMETSSPHKMLKSVIGDGDGQSSSLINRKSSYKQQKHEKLDRNVLRPPKATNKD